MFPVEFGKIFKYHQWGFCSKLCEVEKAIRIVSVGSLFFALKGDFVYLFQKLDDEDPPDYLIWC